MIMENAIKNYEDVDSWKTVYVPVYFRLREVGTKLKILNDEFQHVHQYNPIEHIKTTSKDGRKYCKALKSMAMRYRSRTWLSMSMTLPAYV